MDGDHEKRGRGRKKRGGGRGRGGGEARRGATAAASGGGRRGAEESTDYPPLTDGGGDAFPIPPTRPAASGIGVPPRGRGRGGKTGSGRGGQSPAQVSSASQSSLSLTSAMSEVSLSSSHKDSSSEKSKRSLAHRPMKRPDSGGKDGINSIDIITNHFAVRIKGKILIYIYEVEFSALRSDGRVANRRLNREECHTLFWCGFMQNYRHEFPPPRKMLYDQSKLLMSMEPVLPLNDDYADEEAETTRKDFQIQFNGLQNDQRIEDKERWPIFRMRVSRVNSMAQPIDVSDIQAAYRDNLEEPNHLPKQALELLLRQGLYFKDSFFPAGRNFYYADDKDREFLNLGCGREIRRGFYQSLRTVNNWKITYTLDMKAGVFYSPDECVGIVKRLNRGHDPPPVLSRELLAGLRKEIKGLKLKVTHIGHKFSCADLSHESALTYRFTMKDTEINVDEYFRQTYGINLKYKAWPLAMKGRGKNVRLFPLELCRIADRQRLPQKKVTDDLQAKIVRSTVVPPDVRKNRILETVQNINHKNDERMKEFGVSINMTPIETTGRILKAPKLQYQVRQGGEKECVDPNYGSWNMARNQVFKAGEAIERWGVVTFANPRDLPRNSIIFYCNTLANHAKGMGMSLNVKGLEDLGSINSSPGRWIGDLEGVFKRATKKLQLLLFIMNGKNADIYAAVKKFGEQTCNIKTQCVQALKVQDVVKKPDRSGQLLSNVCLKINAKFCGTNVALYKDPFVKQFFEKPVIFFGADVTHPDPGDKLSPSIAGVAGSQDNYPGQYIGRELVQEHRQEWIGALRGAVREALIGYYQKCRTKPLSIIFYRDGVSEGQFSQILQKEMMEVQAACGSLEATYKPGITFIIVQKRHNTRLFRKKYDPPPPGRQLSTGRKNIPPGTAVDRDIVHPEEFDFYLASHEGIQGTTKPTHYNVLHDDNGFTSDKMQQLSYYLCHTFARCTRSVSLPAPVYYAHLIAFRARMRLKAVFDSEQSRSDSSSLSHDELEKLAKEIQVADDIKKTMYWQ